MPADAALLRPDIPNPTVMPPGAPGLDWGFWLLAALILIGVLLFMWRVGREWTRHRHRKQEMRRKIAALSDAELEAKVGIRLPQTILTDLATTKDPARVAALRAELERSRVACRVPPAVINRALAKITHPDPPPVVAARKVLSRFVDELHAAVRDNDVAGVERAAGELNAARQALAAAVAANTPAPVEPAPPAVPADPLAWLRKPDPDSPVRYLRPEDVTWVETQLNAAREPDTAEGTATGTFSFGTSSPDLPPTTEGQK